MTNRNTNTGTVVSVYTANTTFAHGFSAGNLRPFHALTGSALRINAVICEKKSGTPVMSARVQ